MLPSVVALHDILGMVVHAYHMFCSSVLVGSVGSTNL